MTTKKEIETPWVDMAGSDPKVVITDAKTMALAAIRAALDRLRVRSPESKTIKDLIEKTDND